MDARQVVILDKVTEIEKKHKRAAHVKERHSRLEANLVFQVKVGDMIRRVTGVLDDAEETVTQKDEVEAPKPKKFVSDEEGGGVFGTSKNDRPKCVPSRPLASPRVPSPTCRQGSSSFAASPPHPPPLARAARRERKTPTTCRP